MSKTISELDKVILDELDKFVGVCQKDLETASDAAAKWAVKELKAVSPKNKGDYSKGWKVNKEKTRLGVRTTVWNKDRYMLAHLLEYGHPTGNGGRTKGEIHIKPVEDKASKMFEEKVGQLIENGS